MKRIVVAIVLATVFASVPVLAESRDAAERTIGATATLANALTTASPQYAGLRHRRRRRIARRHRVRRHMYVIRHRRGRRR